MATQTTYYNFNKPSGTDLVNPLIDTNPNWDIADASLHELNERSICNCTEVVSLGVHTLSTLNTDTKFLKWIATANFTAGDTFVLNGDVIVASTPAGATLETGAYVAGSVVLACLNADNSAMTIYVSGTTVADDSNRLGGKLPSYYATASDMSDAQTDITNIDNWIGNTSIVGIGDGTGSGAISVLNTALANFSFRVSGGKAQYSVDGGTTWNDLGGGSMFVDYSNPEWVAASGNISHTAINNGLLVINLGKYGGSSPTVSINSHSVAICWGQPSLGGSASCVVPVSAGDVISLSSWDSMVLVSLFPEK